MQKIRALIVDDAVVIRKLVGQVLTSDNDIEIAGVAANGKIAVAKIPQVNPDIIIMDVEMPDMNGLEALKEIRKGYPLLPVIIFSTLTERGADVTMEALSLGASDYVTKPANAGSLDVSMARVKSDLIPRVKALCSRSRQIQAMVSPTPQIRIVKTAPEPSIQVPSSPTTIDILAIGVSTGGPNALTELIPQIPENFPIPIVIVQHMPPVFTKSLAERLDSKSKIRVLEAKPGDELKSGCAWIAPGNFHMVLLRQGTAVKILTHQGPPENSCRPSVDVLFRSVAEVYGSSTLAVVLTGMGQDGLRGCEQVSQAGGKIFVQDEATSVVWGMPGFVANAGLADKVLALGDIPSEIIKIVERRRPNGSRI